MEYEIKGNIDKPFTIKILLKEITDLIASDNTKNLYDGKGIDGKDLTPNALWYAALKSKKGINKIFWGLSKDTMKLRNSIKYKVYKDSSEIFFDPTKEAVAVKLSKGGRYWWKEFKRWVNIPARDFFGVSKRVMVEVDKYINKTTVE